MVLPDYTLEDLNFQFELLSANTDEVTNEYGHYYISQWKTSATHPDTLEYQEKFFDSWTTQEVNEDFTIKKDGALYYWAYTNNPEDPRWMMTLQVKIWTDEDVDTGYMQAMVFDTGPWVDQTNLIGEEIM